jgi:methanogenic corrinoid protein MtbC1
VAHGPGRRGSALLDVMIRWCCYCQRMIGEVEPLDWYDITHGICERCLVRLDRGDDLLAEHEAVLQLYRDIYVAARQGDATTCTDLAQRAKAAGLQEADILMGLLQPALFEIGRRWERGEVTPADEHRFTAWCDQMMSTVAPSEPPKSAALDLVIFQAPGNRHDVGARMAERALRARGFAVQAVVDDLSTEQMLAIAAAREPAWIGFSCALLQDVVAARERIAALRAAGFGGRILISGQAVRRAPHNGAASDLSVCTTVNEAAALLRSSRPP